MQDSELFGVWTSHGTQQSFSLALQPDYQYLQSWESVPGDRTTPATGRIDHAGTWQIAWSENRPFLVLTLAAANPPMDITAFGWQPPLIGASKCLAFDRVGDAEIRLFGVTLVRAQTFTEPPTAAPASPVSPSTPASPGSPVFPFEPTTDWAAQKQQSEFVDGLVQTGDNALITMIRQTTLPYPEAKPFPYNPPKPFSFNPPRRR